MLRLFPKTEPLQHHAAIPMRSASTDSKTPNYAHTSTPKAYTVTLRQKKNDKPTAAAPAAPTRYLSSSPAATLHGKTQGFVLRFLPKTEPLQHHAAIPMRSASTDSKTPYNYAHTQGHPKQLEATVTLRQKKHQINRPQPHPPHRRGTFHRRLQPLYTEKPRFRAPASSPKQSPCNIMQPFQCDLQAQIPKLPTHTQAHPKQLEATVTLRQKKTINRRSRTRRTDEVPFIVDADFTRKNTRFRAPASSPKQSPCNIMDHSSWLRSLPHHSPSSSLPFLSTSLRHHFPSSPLPFVTTPLHHCLSPLPFVPLPFFTTSLPHHFPSSPLPFIITVLHHFPSSPLAFLTTSLPQFPSSPLPFVTTSLRHLINCFLFFCYVCYVITTLHHFKSQKFYLSV